MLNFKLKYMAEIIKNSKGFKIIEINRSELVEFCDGLGLCDSCNSYTEKGYYIAVLNKWYCPQCYYDFCKNASYYIKDSKIENKNYKHYCEMLGL